MIDVERISKIYRTGNVETKGLSEVSLKVMEGEFVALAGPSGSGKTTLLNILGGLFTPDSGAVRVAGEIVSQMNAHELGRFRLKRIGFVFQDYNLIPTLTVYENIELILSLQGIAPVWRKKRIDNAISIFGLEGMAHRRPYQLSKGQQQRVAVSRTLVARPSVILGDEMTANLDSKTGADLMDFIRSLNKQFKITVLYSTHDPVMIERADRVISLKDGVITSDK